MTVGAAAVIRVSTAGAPYDVFVERGAFEHLPEALGTRAPAERYAVLSDNRVAELHATRLVVRCREQGLSAELFPFPEGEASKNREEWARLTDAMLDAGYGRDACVVAVGGGVTTDLGGFVAATFMRGIPVVHVPTSYLAMIDASVGGKTGVDVRQGKNLVGAFHPPAFVLADPNLLATLPVPDRAQGLVEAFKHGAVMDASYFEALARDLPALLDADARAAEDIVRRSVALKAEVVSADEREEGYRQVLNFGHTVGHALEAASDFAVGHGAAVAAGMLLETEIGERLGVTEVGTSERLEAGLAGLALPPLPPLDPARVVGYLGADKKARGGRARYVLLERIGAVAREGAWSREIPGTLVREVLEGR